VNFLNFIKADSLPMAEVSSIIQAVADAVANGLLPAIQRQQVKVENSQPVTQGDVAYVHNELAKDAEGFINSITKDE
jgi:hypothetical protein